MKTEKSRFITYSEIPKLSKLKVPSASKMAGEPAAAAVPTAEVEKTHNSSSQPEPSPPPPPPPPPQQQQRGGGGGGDSGSVELPKKNLRGLNKPKCSQCGNVARSKCPFKCCKSCCSKAENPCMIHVLKPNADLSDKQRSSKTPTSEPHRADSSSLTSSNRFSALRHHSTSLSGSHLQPRPKRPLTIKEAEEINSWRFAKLRESRDADVEAQDEAFDRYVKNVSLLEEAFGINVSLEGLGPVGEPSYSSNPDGSTDVVDKMVSALKMRGEMNPDRRDRQRRKIQEIINTGLDDLKRWESEHLKQGTQTMRSEKCSALNHLLDKMSKVRSEDDLKACLEIKLKLFGERTCPVTDARVMRKIFVQQEVAEEEIVRVDAQFKSSDAMLEL